MLGHIFDARDYPAVHQFLALLLILSFISVFYVFFIH